MRGKIRSGSLITTEEADLCSKTIDGCSETGCCKTTGYKYTKDTGSTKKSYELDLFAETCMRMHVVEEMDAFDIAKDGCCAAKRKGLEKKNKNSRIFCKDVK